MVNFGLYLSARSTSQAPLWGTVGSSAPLYRSLGRQAVRWDASDTTATELGSLGTNTSGQSFSDAYAVNAAGTAVGWSSKHDTSGVGLGPRAARWYASGTSATELGFLGVSSNGIGTAEAFAVNDAGTAVGYSHKYEASGSNLGRHAVVWLPDASVIDLNELDVLNNTADFWGPGTWQLAIVSGLSEDGYIAGTGTFTPAISGGPYTRHWVAQLGLGGDWLNTTSNDNVWGRGRNWSTSTPAIQLDARFVADANYTVAFDDNESARNVTIADGDVTFALGSRSLTIDQALTISGGLRWPATASSRSCSMRVSMCPPSATSGTWSMRSTALRATSPPLPSTCPPSTRACRGAPPTSNPPASSASSPSRRPQRCWRFVPSA